jgi:hypothetical protein
MTAPATPLFFWTSTGGIQTYCTKEAQLALALHFLTGNNDVRDLLDQDYSEDTLISMVLSASARYSVSSPISSTHA